jgi:hypothetical protein
VSHEEDHNSQIEVQKSQRRPRQKEYDSGDASMSSSDNSDSHPVAKEPHLSSDWFVREELIFSLFFTTGDEGFIALSDVCWEVLLLERKGFVTIQER